MTKGPLVFLLPETLKLFGFEVFSTLSIPDYSYSRNVSCALNLISTFLLQLDGSGINRIILVNNV